MSPSFHTGHHCDIIVRRLAKKVKNFISRFTIIKIMITVHFTLILFGFTANFHCQTQLWMVHWVAVVNFRVEYPRFRMVMDLDLNLDGVE